MIVVAVEHLDIYSGLSHPPRELAQLARNRLFEALHNDVTLGKHANPGLLECRARGAAVGKEKVRDPATINDPRPSALDADAGASQRFPHVGQCAGPIIEFNGNVLYGRLRWQFAALINARDPRAIAI